MRQVTVVDYGVGNLFSVRRALEKCGAEVTISSSASAIAGAQRLVLPGVGAFADGMKGLEERGLVDAMRSYGNGHRPLLGICLGMQLLLTRSDEFGSHKGLNVIPGNVVAVPNTSSTGEQQKIPLMGWHPLELPARVDGWGGSVLARVRPGEFVYLVHSFTAVPDDARHRLADCHYGGRLIAAAVRSGNVFGCQFHPEKSGPVGLRVLEEFIAL